MALRRPGPAAPWSCAQSRGEAPEGSPPKGQEPQGYLPSLYLWVLPPRKTSDCPSNQLVPAHRHDRAQSPCGQTLADQVSQPPRCRRQEADGTGGRGRGPPRWDFPRGGAQPCRHRVWSGPGIEDSVALIHLIYWNPRPADTDPAQSTHCLRPQGTQIRRKEKTGFWLFPKETPRKPLPNSLAVSGCGGSPWGQA